jgi:hypothetical protein
MQEYSKFPRTLEGNFRCPSQYPGSVLANLEFLKIPKDSSRNFESSLRICRKCTGNEKVL